MAILRISSDVRLREAWDSLPINEAALEVFID
jgi:hypothetical protein